MGNTLIKPMTHGPTDALLLGEIGFKTFEEQTLIIAFAKEVELPVRELLRVALRTYHNRYHPVPPSHPLHQPYGCPDLS